MCDVLILTSAFGNGHISVANAISEQLKDENDNLNIIIEDIMNIATPRTKDVYFDIYTLLTSKYPNIYNFFYKIKKETPNNDMDTLLYSVYMKRVSKYIKDLNPKLIVSTFPLGSGFISKIKEYYDIDIPLVTTITDVVDSWEWIHQKTDMYFVPCESIQQALMRKGISRDKIRVTGIPVKKEFLDNVKVISDRPQVLVMGGVMTDLGLSKELLMELDTLNYIKIVVITGKNEELYNNLTEDVQYENVEVLGYVDNVAYFMEHSDLVITKPGGVTLFEAINKGIPVILKNSLVGQEEHNIEFIKSMGIGLFIEDGLCLKDQIVSALGNLDELNNMREKFKEIRMEIQPAKVGEYVLELM